MKTQFTSKDRHLSVIKKEYFWHVLELEDEMKFFFIFARFYHLFFLVIVSHFETRIGDEFVILRNDALMKCQVPSFVSDFLSVTGWVDERLENLNSANGKTGGIMER